MKILYLPSFVIMIIVIFSGCSQSKVSRSQATADHYVQGLEYQTNGQNALALKEYRTVIAIDDLHWPAHYRTGYILEQQGDLQGAITEYRKVIQIDHFVVNPAGKSTWHYRLAMALWKAKQNKEALSEFQLAYHIAATDKKHSKKIAAVAAQSLHMMHELKKVVGNS